MRSSTAIALPIVFDHGHVHVCALDLVSGRWSTEIWRVDDVQSLTLNPITEWCPLPTPSVLSGQECTAAKRGLAEHDAIETDTKTN